MEVHIIQKAPLKGFILYSITHLYCNILGTTPDVKEVLKKKRKLQENKPQTQGTQSKLFEENLEW